MIYAIMAASIVAMCVVAILVGRFLGTNNAVCYSEFNNQGRKRLDDCDIEECHKKGCCRFKPTLEETK